LIEFYGEKIEGKLLPNFSQKHLSCQNFCPQSIGYAEFNKNNISRERDTRHQRPNRSKS